VALPPRTDTAVIRGSDFLAQSAPILAEANGDGRVSAVLRIRLCGLVDAGMRLGYPRAERLVEGLRQQAQETLRGAEVVAQIGPADLVILLAKLSDDQQAMLAAARLLRLLSPPLATEHGELEPDPAIGIAMAPVHGDGADTLSRRAEAALHRALMTSDRLAMYSPTAQAELVEPEDLREAIRTSALDMHFQPVWDLRGDRLAGAEVLARWHHPRRGEISPSTFVAVAEQSGLLPEFTRWSIHAALRALAAARRVGFDLPISINVSARAFSQRGLAEQIADALNLWGIPAFMVELEVTETAVLEDRELGGRVLSQLHEEGVCVAIDDFGVGSSSFTYLRDLPVDRIKIDQSFVRDILANRRSLMLVHGMIDLGHRLGISVVAEGVEDAATLTRLAALGCDFAQGWQIGHPQPMAEFLTEYAGLRLASD
jgi:EAL domain-containing protein (putative c-di-GMP-specific phosphodiesterase class I)/GGDEF domain-containing protein